jgi:predicted DNA-binding transcriptional regulator AlpA
VTVDLDTLDAVPIAQVPELIGTLEAAKARLWARLARVDHRHDDGCSGGDATVDVREAARLLGMSPTWVYRHARRLPFSRRVGGRALRFSVAGIRRYLASRRPATSGSSGSGRAPRSGSRAA